MFRGLTFGGHGVVKSKNAQNIKNENTSSKSSVYTIQYKRTYSILTV